MGKKTNSKELFAQKSKEELMENGQSGVHKYGDNFICATDRSGHSTPGDRSPLEILVDASESKGEKEVVFSNLVKVPIKGAIKQVELSLVYQDSCLQSELLEFFIRVIEPPGGGRQLSQLGQ